MSSPLSGAAQGRSAEIHYGGVMPSARRRTTTPAALDGETTAEHIDSGTAGTMPRGAAHGGRGGAASAKEDASRMASADGKPNGIL